MVVPEHCSLTAEGFNVYVRYSNYVKSGSGGVLYICLTPCHIVLFVLVSSWRASDIGSRSTFA